ncbi:YdcF family protein [Paenisporosarcina quisquiliarum]|uniref:YdcF family protein n=1 Tax=Paenisporosarcina quisquiliarum TaxID=365346 RepID=A0A9X3LL70_9BACL|nr:YdcF family protein [Paenisporosarcina quisquiliarum]
MNISQLEPNKLTDLQMTELIYSNLEDDNKNGDCILVPGSNKAVEYRLPKAIQLYKQGRANKILFSGGVIWEGNKLTEAQLLKEKAIEQGIPEEDIIVEDVSLHTKENVLASLLVLDRAFYLHNIKRIIVVTTNFHMRRFHLTLKTFMPDWIEYSLCTVNDQTTREDNWFNYPYGRKRVEMESGKLINYVKQGIIIDDKVEISKE